MVDGYAFRPAPCHKPARDMIGTRRFSNGDANRESAAAKVIKPTVDNGFRRAGIFRRFLKNNFPVSFCAEDEIFAS
jgi:hypothetical protein